jgi:dTMP kinase
LTETLLLFAARADHVARAIRPALEAGRFVVCDRFTDSTYAYQGAGRGTPRETIRRIESIVLEDFKPDLTIVLDLPSEVGLRRAMARGPAEGRFEKFDPAFHERLRQAFLDIARRAPDRCVVVDASANQEVVARAILDAVIGRFGL